jgi:hypothetical protein
VISGLSAARLASKAQKMTIASAEAEGVGMGILYQLCANAGRRHVDMLDTCSRISVPLIASVDESNPTMVRPILASPVLDETDPVILIQQFPGFLRIIWLQIFADTSEFVSSCFDCHTAKLTNLESKHGYLHPIEVPHPWDLVAVVVKESACTVRAAFWLLVMIDVYWVILLVEVSRAVLLDLVCVSSLKC